MGTLENRRTLAELLAEHFLHHLKDELRKPESLLSRKTKSGPSFREVTLQMTEDLHREFPGLKGNSTWNLIEEWVVRRNPPVAYGDSTFRSYNIPFFARLLDIRDGTGETRLRLREGIAHLLSTGNFYGSPITFQIFFHSESVMRELIRELLENGNGPGPRFAWDIIREQSEFWAHCGYEYFDGVLGNSLLELQKQRDEAQARAAAIHKEMEAAHDIQLSILPERAPRMTDCGVGAVYLPADRIGGDFYDFLVISQCELGVLIADVTGHGVPAALIASMLKISFRHQSHLARQPTELLNQMNTEIPLPRDRYISAGYLYLNLELGEGSYTSAGHDGIYFRRISENKTTEVTSLGTLFGVTLGPFRVNPVKFEIRPGDRILVYTDGVTDVRNSSGELYGHARLAQSLAMLDGQETSAALQSLVENLEAWADRNPFTDDVTAVLLDLWPQAEA